MMRITTAALAGAVARLNSITHHRQAFRYEHVAGGYRIVRDSGKQKEHMLWWTVSPTLGTKRELFLWIDAYTYGIYDGQTILMNHCGGGQECGITV
jgi:hypothetical protein